MWRTVGELKLSWHLVVVESRWAEVELAFGGVRSRADKVSLSY
jgi:hypothetical protein